MNYFNQNSTTAVLLGTSTSEFKLLWLLASHVEEVLSRDYIYRTLCGIEYDGLDRTVD